MDELTPIALAAGRGDQPALTRLIRATQADVWRLCAHLAGPGSDDGLVIFAWVPGSGAGRLIPWNGRASGVT